MTNPARGLLVHVDATPGTSTTYVPALSSSTSIDHIPPLLALFSTDIPTTTSYRFTLRWCFGDFAFGILGRVGDGEHVFRYETSRATQYVCDPVDVSFALYPHDQTDLPRLRAIRGAKQRRANRWIGVSGIEDTGCKGSMGRYNVVICSVHSCTPMSM